MRLLTMQTQYTEYVNEQIEILETIEAEYCKKFNRSTVTDYEMRLFEALLNGVNLQMAADKNPAIANHQLARQQARA